MLKGKDRIYKKYATLVSNIGQDYMDGKVDWKYFVDVLERSAKKLGQVPKY